MAKKNNGETTEGEAPVKKAPAKPQDNYASLQAKRRELETELAGIDGGIKGAINAGDVSQLAKLTARKLELPGLFIAASMAETTLRNEMQNAEDAEIASRLNTAITERDERKALFEKREREFAQTLAELNRQWLEAEQQVNSLYSEIAGSRNLGADRTAGFKKSLANLVP